MGESIKQLLLQLRNIWDKLNGTQKVILGMTAVITLAGLIGISMWSSGSSTGSGGYTTLFVNVESEDAAKITDALKDMKLPYKFDNNGRTVLVPKEQLYEARMQMARLGLPQSGGQGYEIFDKLQLGMTDFVQNLNYRRALEGELSRTIESLKEVDKARVHVTIPKPSLFTEKKEEATASVIIKLKPGEEIEDKQVRGIAFLVASSVEGLKSRQVTILDIHGNMLTKGFADNAVAEQTDHNLTMQNSVEKQLEQKVLDIFNGLLGPNKTRVKIAAELDFDQVQKSVESYDPNTKVVRSQQRDDGLIKGSPNAQLDQKEGSITNYEFDKTQAQIISAVGTRKRITVSMAVDGIYKTDKEGQKNFSPRSQEELDKYTALVKNAVGFQPGSKDEIYVTCVQFDNQYLMTEEEDMKKIDKQETYKFWGKIGMVAAILIFALIFLRGLAQNLVSAMNPPAPRYAGLDLEPEVEVVPENIQKQKEMMEKVEIMSQTEPTNMANLIKTWLNEGRVKDNSKKKK